MGKIKKQVAIKSPVYLKGKGNTFISNRITGEQLLDENGNLIIDGYIQGYRKMGTPITDLTHTFTLEDKNSYIRALNTSNQTITIPLNSIVPFETGTEIEIFQAGVGQVSFVASSGVVVNSKDSNLSLSSQFSAAVLKKIATDEWDLIGDLA